MKAKFLAKSLEITSHLWVRFTVYGFYTTFPESYLLLELALSRPSLKQAYGAKKKNLWLKAGKHN